MTDAYERSLELLAKVQRTLDAPRVDASSWERTREERRPKPQPDLRRELRTECAKMRAEFNATLEALAVAIGEQTGRTEREARERLDRMEREHAQSQIRMLAKIMSLEQQLAGRAVMTIGDDEERHVH